MSWDPYLDLSTGVLRNVLGITDPTELAGAEADFTTLRIAQLHRTPLPGSYDLSHLQAFHRHIFGDIYEWAGELRTVSIGRGVLFCLPEHIAADADELFAWLARPAPARPRPRRLRRRAHGAPVATSTPCTRSATATAAPSGPSSPSSRATQATPSAGRRWTRPRTSRRPEAAQEGDVARLHAMLDKLVRRPAPSRTLAPTVRG